MAIAVESFDIGDGIYLRVTFTDVVTGNLADPTNVVLKVRDAAGTITTPQVFRSDVGKYFSKFVTTNQPGIWMYRIEATGDLDAVEKGKFVVRPSDFV